jgi:uncharacterized lipoprotein YajG
VFKFESEAEMTKPKTFGTQRFYVNAGARRRAGLLLAAMLAACVNGKPLPISLAYTPEQTVVGVSGAQFVYVDVTVNDKRSAKETVGEFSSDVATRPIVTHDDLTKLVKSALESELRNRGFELGAGNAVVVVDLNRIEVKRTVKAGSWANISRPFLEISTQAMAIMNVLVKRKTGEVLYSKQISGKASFTGTQNETLSSDCQRGLNYALDRLVRNQMAEPAFINALLATR